MATLFGLPVDFIDDVRFTYRNIPRPIDRVMGQPVKMSYLMVPWPKQVWYRHEYWYLNPPQWLTTIVGLFAAGLRIDAMVGGGVKAAVFIGRTWYHIPWPHRRKIRIAR